MRFHPGERNLGIECKMHCKFGYIVIPFLVSLKFKRLPSYLVSIIIISAIRSVS
jgi:hypothetical protein